MSSRPNSLGSDWLSLGHVARYYYDARICAAAPALNNQCAAEQQVPADRWVLFLADDTLYVQIEHERF